MARQSSLLLRFFRKLVLLALILGGLSLTAIWYVGAWNLIFPSHQHDSEAPLIPTGLPTPSVLIFSKTNSFRHKGGIAGGLRALQAIGREQGWGVFATENGAIFNANDLARFKAVVFLNASGDILDEQQEQAFQSWLESGGGWLGIHAAGNDSHGGWLWYADNLIGANFTAHTLGPLVQIATVILENQQHPALAGVPDVWKHEEEWYSFAQSPRSSGFTVLASVDEDSYTPRQKFLWHERDLSMGDHPVVWSTCIGEGRALYSALGHEAGAYANEPYRRLLKNGLHWLMGLSSGGCAPGDSSNPGG